MPERDGGWVDVDLVPPLPVEREWVALCAGKRPHHQIRTLIDVEDEGLLAGGAREVDICCHAAHRMPGLTPSDLAPKPRRERELGLSYHESTQAKLPERDVVTINAPQ
jgi:hypothetical protein